MATDDSRTSPFTGHTRAHWAEAADRMLLAVRPFASADHARVDLPGPPSAFGRDSDALEGFARTFLLAAFRLRGESGVDPHGFAQWYADGLRAGTDPGSPDAWPRPDQLDQAKVEAASIALGLQLTRPWLWDRLDPGVQEQVVGWLGTAVGQHYFPNNWVWFQLVTETFLRSVGGPWSADDIAAALALHASLYRDGGWYADGPTRSFDHYNGWALHLYPLLWAEFAGELCTDAMRQAWRDRLAQFLDDAVLLIGGDGSPLIQGRSLTYRFAAAAPFWMGALTGATNLSPGTIRRVCSGMLGHFAAHGAPDEHGLLPLGWHHAWPAMAQSYSGPGSPYWASKGMLGLALPADHPVWTAAEEPLPIERGDTAAALAVPGWLVSGTRRDGVVRVVNHGTDRATPGDPKSDAPLYARLGYSTATLPPLVGPALGSPPDNSVAIVDAAGNASHRNGFELLSCAQVDGTGIAVSRAHTHWVAIEEDAGPDHAAGRAGTVRPGPVITMGSAVRGAVEVRAARVDSAVPGEGAVLEFSGWPVTQGSSPDGDTADACAEVTGGRLTSSLTGLAGFASAAIRRLDGTSPLGEHTAIPVLRTATVPEPGQVFVAVVLLTGTPSNEELPTVAIAGHDLTISWPDGPVSQLTLPPYG